MAIAFRSAKNAASKTCTKPTGTTSGDVLVAFVIDEGNHTITPPAGWTQIDNISINGGSMRHASFYKVAGGSEGSSYTWTITGSTYTEICIAAYSGVDNTTPINTNNSGSENGSSTLTVPNVTTTVANCEIAIATNEWFGRNWVSVAPYNANYTLDSGISTGSSWDMASGHRAVTTATTYGGDSVGWSSSVNGNYHSVLVVALQPAGSGSAVNGAAAFNVEADATDAGVVAYVAAASANAEVDTANAAVMAYAAAAAASVDADVTAQAAMAYAALLAASVEVDLTGAAVLAIVGQMTANAEVDAAAAGVQLLVALAALSVEIDAAMAGTVSNGTIQGAAAMIVEAVATASATVAHTGAAAFTVDIDTTAASIMALAAAAVLSTEIDTTAAGVRAVLGAANLSVDAVAATLGQLHIAGRMAAAVNADATLLAALILVGAAALNVEIDLTGTGVKQNTNWRPPTGVILLQAALAAALALQSTPVGTIILQDSPEGTIE